MTHVPYRQMNCMKICLTPRHAIFSSRDFNAPKTDINGMLDDLAQAFLDPCYSSWCYTSLLGKKLRNATLQNPFVQQLLAKARGELTSRHKGKWEKGGKVN